MGIADGFRFWIGKELGELVFGLGMFATFIVVGLIVIAIYELLQSLRERKKRDQPRP
jgi:hypothetical protein